MSKKIIIVDDSRSVRQQVGVALTGAGYEVIDAEDGLDGLDKIRGHRDAAMVLCDINMPRMNGLDLIEAVRKDSASDGLPIVMLTTEVRADLVARAKQAGIKGWIVKPFKPDLLVAAVRKLAGPA